MAEIILSIKFTDEEPISLVLEEGGKIDGGMQMHLEQNQLLKTHMGTPYTLSGRTRMSVPLLEKLDYYKKLTWNDSKTATVLHKIVNGTDVLSSRFFKKAVFTQVNTMGDLSERGGKVLVDIALEMLGEEGFSVLENSL